MKIFAVLLAALTLGACGYGGGGHGYRGAAHGTVGHSYGSTHVHGFVGHGRGAGIGRGR